MASEKTVLAIDPGSSKCGMALVRRGSDGDLELLWRTVAPNAELDAQIDMASRVAPFSMVIVGSGTTSRAMVQRLREHIPSVGILLVDEKNTTVQAIERYWEHNPRRGWRRLIPSSIQTPPEPVDDFAALILAERVLEN